MKKNQIFFLLVSLFALSGCKKNNDINSPNPTVTSQQVLADFANFVANPNYIDIAGNAALLNASVQALYQNTTDYNLNASQNAWRQTRKPWEQSEAFLLGPVEDFNYDPALDSWPVNHIDMDSLLAGTNPLMLSDIDALPASLKGFHAIEYMLFGYGGSKKAADFTPRQLQYLVSLSQCLYNTAVSLRNSWDTNHGNFTNEIITAGAGSTRYPKQQDAFIAIINALTGICEEVAEAKMQEPLANQDSTLEESQFSHNSTADFQNNIKGVLNVYLAKYSAKGHGLNELVAGRNLSLDNTLQQQMNAAINSFNNINPNYGQAIYTQQVQIIAAQNAINNLHHTLENDLMDFILMNIKE